jgi:tetratricopeptide (TPR) repeat protein
MFKTYKLIILIAFSIFSGTAFGQSKSLDSLQNALKTYTKKDTVRVNLLNKIATEIFATDVDRAIVLLKESGEISDKLNYKKGKAYSMLFTGNTLIKKAEYKQALINFQNALAIYEDLYDKFGMANCLFNFGRSYFYMGDLAKAESYYKKAIALCEETGDQRRLSASLLGLGVIYARQADYAKGIETYKKALQIDEKSGNKRGIANNLISLANIYRKQALFPLALEYYSRGLEIKQQMADPPGIAAAYNNMGMLYEDMDKDKDALEYYKKALEIFEKLKYKNEIVLSLVNIGIIYMNHEMSAESMQCYQKALALAREINSVSNIGSCLLNIGSLHYLNKEYDAALSNLEDAAKIFKKMDSKEELAFIYLKMGFIYKIKKDYKKALYYASESSVLSDKAGLIEYQRDISKLRSEIYYENQEYKLAYENSASLNKLHDSIYKKENIDGIAQVKYKYEFKDSLNSAKLRENSLKRTVKVKDAELMTSHRRTMWWIVGFACLLIALCIILALVKIRRVKMRNKQLLTEQKLLRSQMNPHFIFNSLQNIRSLIHNKREEEAVNYLNRFSSLTRQILETSNENYISLEEEIGIIKNYLAIQQLLFSHPFNYQLEVDEEIDQESVFIPPMLTQPFIENAIKHGLSGSAGAGVINIRFYLKEQRLFFEICDNGVGFGTLKKEEGHKSMAMNITRERLINYSKNPESMVHADNITDADKNVIGAKVVFEIPYLYEN